ncbi:unnamed protein product [Polarella glacialis]|uniref:Uncharacterized protein n=1 Tax=Polarella glacialis TaxID=89957 RepID=A0A813D7E0_POLGL|nr:unnamed protein product [Polarella glacialis]
MIITLSPVVVLVTSTMHFMEDSEYDAQRILLELFPKTFVLLGIIRVLSRIGEVTGNCDRLPVFLNSLLLGDGWDWEASHLIRFIERSKAGFYVFDTKVDYTVMSKVAYIFSGGLLALLAEAWLGTNNWFIHKEWKRIVSVVLRVFSYGFVVVASFFALWHECC